MVKLSEFFCIVDVFPGFVVPKSWVGVGLVCDPPNNIWEEMKII